MGYDVTTWKTKELQSLTIPVNALFADPDWQPEQSVDFALDATFTLRWGESYIKGAPVGEPVTQRNGFLPPDSTQMFAVDEISVHGEGSGYLLWKVIKPALEKSKGRLVAARIWEGGDSVDRLVVVDGDVNEQDVDL
jgi:hypothetical protein